MHINHRQKKKHNWALILLYTVSFLIPIGGLAALYLYYNGELRKIPEAKIVVISKQDMKLRVYDYKGNKVVEYGIACGKNYGQKYKVGDMKTPEGMFYVSGIEDASGRTHDFGDGRGAIPGAYGPYFIRLDTPGHKGIGIHGTHDPESIGTRATEGCIRLHNEDVAELAHLIYPGTMVIVTSSFLDYEQETVAAKGKNETIDKNKEQKNKEKDNVVTVDKTADPLLEPQGNIIDNYE